MVSTFSMNAIALSNVIPFRARQISRDAFGEMLSSLPLALT